MGERGFSTPQQQQQTGYLGAVGGGGAKSGQLLRVRLLYIYIDGEKSN